MDGGLSCISKMDISLKTLISLLLPKNVGMLGESNVMIQQKMWLYLPSEMLQISEPGPKVTIMTDLHATVIEPDKFRHF